ncbi:hypothetical protein MMC18_006607 [Xylographa bjoerkii]|nr:hypothetical protein [Xylographa bjoerkii]
MALVIVTITTVPQLVVENSDWEVKKPGVKLVIWDPSSDYRDGDGSKQPVAYQTPGDEKPTYPTGLVVDCFCTFPVAYAGKQCTAIASLPIGAGGGLVTVLTSATFLIPASLPNPPTPIPVSFKGLTIASPSTIPDDPCPVPFRWAGDFQWAIKTAGLPDLDAPLSTRLELCWAVAAAPSGPSWVPHSFMRTQLDLQGKYPISLLRWFFPSPPEFAGVANFDINYKSWYARRSIMKIWDWGNPHAGTRPQYDADSGASKYNMGACGGSFEWDEWVTADYPTLNCYDLAGISQLSCGLLVADYGDELLDSRWVFQTPNGYPLTGTLYGWGAPTCPNPPGVNNPFFRRPLYPQPWVQPGLAGANLRSPFGNHAWVEVTLDDPMHRGVLDTTLAVPPGPDVGTRTRNQYAVDHIDYPADPTGAKTGNLVNVLTAGGTGGNCYTNNEFSLPFTVGGAPAAGIARVGVYSINDINPMKPLSRTTTVPFPAPPPIQAEIEAVITRGTNPDLPDRVINDATLDEASLLPLVIGETSLQQSKSDLKISAGATRLQLRLRESQQDPDNLGVQAIATEVLIRIHTYEHFEHAIYSLGAEFMKYQTSISDTFSALQNPVGAISVKTSTSVLFVRGNSLVVIELLGFPPANRSAALDLEAMAQRIDTYLAENPAQPSGHRRPNLRLHHAAPTTVHVGESFSLKLQDVDSLARQTYTHTSNGRVIVSAGKADASGVFTFHAIAPGTAEITLSVAHHETLHPAHEMYIIEVVE